MIKKTLYCLLILTVFFTPVSVFMRSVCFYLAVLLFLLYPLQKYWRKLSYIDVFFVLAFVVYLIQLVKFKNFENWWSSFSGCFLIHLLLFQMLNLVRRGLEKKGEKSKFIHGLLAVIFISAVFSSFYVLYQYPEVIRPFELIKADLEAGKYELTGYFIKSGAWKVSLLSERNIYATGKWGHWNIYSAHLVLAVLIGLFFMKQKYSTDSRVKLILLWGVMIILIFNLYLTFSRAALLISLPVAVFILIVSDFRQLKWNILGLGFLVVPIAFAVTVFASKPLTTTLQNRISQVKTLGERVSTERDPIFKRAVSKIAKNFVWGVGAGNIKNMYGNPVNFRRGAIKTAHNIFLQKWLELGLAGFLLYLVFFGVLIFKNARFIYQKHVDKEKYLPGVVTFSWLFVQILRNLWDYLFIDSGYGFLFWTVVFINLVILEEGGEKMEERSNGNE